MNQITLLIINFILYCIILFFIYRLKNHFDKKMENYRAENVKAIEMFRDELFRKSRRFELKYEIFKGITWALSQIHWLITRIDWEKIFKASENILYQTALVSNFYGEDVNKKLNELGALVKDIMENRTALDNKLNQISWEKAELEEQKKYLNIISSSEPKNYEEIINRIKLETKIKIKDEQIFKEQTEIISKILNDVTASFIKVGTLVEALLISMASELKEEYKL